MDSSSAASTSTSITPATTHHKILPHHYNHHPLLRRKEKVLFIVGATDCGKSKLSIDLATRYVPHSAEIINSDKMKVYNGLDITTNKISVSDRRSVPHHLLGDVDPLHGEFTPAEFRFSPWRYPPWRGGGERRGTGEWDKVGRVVDEDAVREINENTCRLMLYFRLLNGEKNIKLCEWVAKGHND